MTLHAHPSPFPRCPGRRRHPHRGLSSTSRARPSSCFAACRPPRSTSSLSAPLHARSAGIAMRAAPSHRPRALWSQHASVWNASASSDGALEIVRRPDGAPPYQELLYEASRFQLAGATSPSMSPRPEDIEFYDHVRRTGVLPEMKSARDPGAAPHAGRLAPSVSSLRGSGRGPRAAPASPFAPRLRMNRRSESRLR